MIDSAGPLRPPLPRRLAYRFLGVRVPYTYRYWVRDDVLGRWYHTRQTAGTLVFLIVLQVLFGLAIPLVFVATGEGEFFYVGPRPWIFLLYAALLAVAALLNLLFPRFGRRARRYMLHRHGFHEDGTPMTAPPATTDAWRGRAL